jgi:MFS family permease
MSESLRDYCRLLGSRAVGAAILWIDFTLIFETLAFRWEANPMWIGFAMTLYGLPGIVVGPWLGSLADRRCPWRLLRWSYAARALVSIGLWQAPTFGLFLGCIAMKGVVNVMPAPAEQQLFRRLLDDSRLAANAGRVTLIDQTTKLVAPLVTVLTARAGVPGFSISALLGVAGLLLTAGKRLHSANSPQRGARARPIWRAFFSVLGDNAVLRRVFIVTLCQAFVLGLYDAQLALLLKAQGFPDGTFGSIVGCTAAGAMIGAFLFQRIQRHIKTRPLLCVSCLLFGSTILTPAIMAYAAVPIPLPLMLSLWVGNGFAYGLGAMLTMVTFQRECPIESLGTVTSTGRSLQITLLILAPLVGGALSSATSLEFVFLLAGMFSIGLGLLAMRPLNGLPSSRSRPH